MLSYQHAYHAGNPADLHKHIVLAELIERLTVKDRPITYAETHAGRALYDTKSPEALKTGEAAMGVAKGNWSGDSPFERVLSTVRASHGPSYYPGSPTLALELTRQHDRIVLMELHPQESEALDRAFSATRAELHHRDGYEGVLGLAPMTPRKGLVLIDPAYEVKSEYEQVAAFVPQLLQKWPEATILIWYPILSAGRHAAMIESLSDLNHLRDEIQFNAKKDHGMKASGLFLANPPFGSDACFESAHRLAAPILKSTGIHRSRQRA
ncbi:MAG: 23S rRNA (adenine(2030)-N(6))-methyltransferase RlmJ [Parvularcula sp.]